MPRVEVFSWNPRRSNLPRRLTQRLPFEVGRRVHNFGDLLGPLLVTRILERHGIDANQAPRDRRLLSVGSVLHFARDGDVVWGTGVNGKKSDADHVFNSLDVRAVRGPRTRKFLQDRGIDVPAIFGDPALLLPILMPELVAWSEHKRHPVTVVPNLNDYALVEASPDVLDPRLPVDACLRRIAESEFVVGSSLHAIIVAESLGIPARLLLSTGEPRFKYDDYYLSTGRGEAMITYTVNEAMRLGGERPPKLDTAPLLAAFPFDLWDA